MRELYDTIMNESLNPLRALPKAQRFQLMMLLSTMWTTLFCLSFGLWAYWGSLMAIHLPLALGVMITGMTFNSASKHASRDLCRVSE